MKAYSPEFRETVLQRILPPASEPLRKLAKETRLSVGTLHKWRADAVAKGVIVINGGKSKEPLSSGDKFLVVLETAQLNEIELSEYCRRRGLFVEQVKEWQDTCMQANEGLAKVTNQLQKELKQRERVIKDLQKDLNGKNAALAETAALLVLRKKASAIWGDGEDA
jgi:transposase